MCSVHHVEGVYVYPSNPCPFQLRGKALQKDFPPPEPKENLCMDSC